MYIYTYMYIYIYTYMYITRYQNLGLGFVNAKDKMSRPCWGRLQPVFQDRFPVMGTAHVLIFRVMDRDMGTVALDWLFGA